MSSNGQVVIDEYSDNRRNRFRHKAGQFSRRNLFGVDNERRHSTPCKRCRTKGNENESITETRSRQRSRSPRKTTIFCEAPSPIASSSPRRNSSGIGSSVGSSSKKNYLQNITNRSWAELADEDEEEFWMQLSKVNSERSNVHELWEECDEIASKDVKSEADAEFDEKDSYKARNAMSSPVKGKRKRFEFETDLQVLERKQKQIDYGKNTIGYQNYLKSVPKFKRSHRDMNTPNKYYKYSRRSWDQQIKIWRKFLHRYDPPDMSDVSEIDVDVSDFMSDVIFSSPTTSRNERSAQSSPSKFSIVSMEEFPPLTPDLVSSPANNEESEINEKYIANKLAEVIDESTLTAETGVQNIGKQFVSKVSNEIYNDECANMDIVLKKPVVEATSGAELDESTLGEDFYKTFKSDISLKCEMKLEK